jgi:hypothetical protein
MRSRTLSIFVFVVLHGAVFGWDSRVDEFLAGIDAHRAAIHDVSGDAVLRVQIEEEVLKGTYHFQILGDLWNVRMQGELRATDGTVINAFKERNQTRMLQGSVAMNMFHERRNATVNTRQGVAFCEGLVLAGIDSVEPDGRHLGGAFDYARNNPESVSVEYEEHSTEEHLIRMTYRNL